MAGFEFGYECVLELMAATGALDCYVDGFSISRAMTTLIRVFYDRGVRATSRDFTCGPVHCSASDVEGLDSTSSCILFIQIPLLEVHVAADLFGDGASHTSVLDSQSTVYSPGEGAICSTPSEAVHELFQVSELGFVYVDADRARHGTRLVWVGCQCPVSGCLARPV